MPKRDTILELCAGPARRPAGHVPAADKVVGLRRGNPVPPSIGDLALASALAEPRVADTWLLYCEAIARLRKTSAAMGCPARAEAQLRLTLPRLMRWLDRDWDAERRLLCPASRRVFDRVLFDCLRAVPARRRCSVRRVRAPGRSGPRPVRGG